jgi:hypothetical protein
MPKIKKYNDVNKYKILEEIQECFLYLTDFFKKHEGEYISDMVCGEYMLYINDTKDNRYADNNYYFELNLDGYEGIPKGVSTNVDFLKNTKFYNDFKSVLNRLSHINELKFITFSYKNIDDGYHGNGVSIKMIANVDQDYRKDILNDEKLISSGFSICDTYAVMEFKSCNLVLHKMGGSDIIIFDKSYQKRAEVTLESGIYFDKFSATKFVKSVVDSLDEAYDRMKPKTNSTVKFLIWLKNNTSL